ncbi:MAG TPA: ATP-binding protein [Thermoleophilaceae bacterium]|nr:ATP-binding protein [Thermoleophilaceae bacterium]
MNASAFKVRDLSIRADLARIGEARDWAARAAQDFGLAEDERFLIRLAMSEAVTNAILHGSGSDCDAVELEAREEQDALVFEVRDCGAEGNGHVERLHEGGRGLELVSLVMDEVELDQGEQGSVLRFAKHRHAA